MTDIVEQAARRLQEAGAPHADSKYWAKKLADAGLLTDGTNYAALVKEAQRSGCAVEIDGVRIHPCDTYGNDTTKPTRTVPTRDQIVDVLVMSPLADTAGTDLAPFNRAADAVLALMAESCSHGLDHDDTTETTYCPTIKAVRGE